MNSSQMITEPSFLLMSQVENNFKKNPVLFQLARWVFFKGQGALKWHAIQGEMERISPHKIYANIGQMKLYLLDQFHWKLPLGYFLLVKPLCNKTF